MKKVIVALLLFPSMLFAQEYSEVVEVSGKNADQLYTSARMWFAEKFKSANEVLQMDDRENGVIIGKGNISSDEYYSAGMGIQVQSNWIVKFTIKVMVKDGRYKCDMNDFTVDRYALGELLTKDEPLSQYVDKKEYFKNGSETEWLKNNGVKSNTQMMARTNNAIFNHITKFENDIPTIYESLRKAMSANDNW